MKNAIHAALSATISIVLVMGINGCVGGKQCAKTVSPAAGKISAERIDISGLWKMAVTSSYGSGTPSFDLVQQGDRVSGTYSGLFGKFPVTGSVSGNTFVLQFDSNGTIAKYIGKADGDTVKGKVVFGSYEEATFTGQKR